MRNWLLIGIYLMLLSKASHAEWVKIGSNDDIQVTIFIDNHPTKIIKEISSVKILYDFSKPNNDLKMKHSSELELIDLNCKQKQFTLRDVRWLLGQMGAGSTIWRTQNLDSQAIEKDTVYEVAYRFACNK